MTPTDPKWDSLMAEKLRIEAENPRLFRVASCPSKRTAEDRKLIARWNKTCDELTLLLPPCKYDRGVRGREKTRVDE